MTDNLEGRFARRCRLCTEEQETSIMIFGSEANEMLLQNKLNKYLLIEVDEDDKLPKNICIQCCNKLQIVCDFIDMAREAQDKLLKQSLILENMSTTSHISIIKGESDMYVDSYDDENKSTELEVNVDPMMVLQNNDETFSSHSEDHNHCNNTEVNGVLHYNEDVTIKLISKGRSEPVFNVTEKVEEEMENDKKPFPCLICKRSYFTELALKNHIWTHGSPDDEASFYKCPICDEGFDYKTHLMDHVKKHRAAGMCQICGRVFRSEYNLEIHMGIHDSSSEAYTCRICGRSYKTRSNLKTHSITHSNDRPFKCSLCKKSFKRNQDLKFHINQHTGAKPYKCPFCDKSFASSGNCYSHRSRMHPGKKLEHRKIRRKRIVVPKENNTLAQQKPITPKMPIVSVKGIQKYQCQICFHSFLRKDNFTYHMYQHTGEKPFQCSLCEEKFVTRKGLLLHHDKDHPGKDRPLGLLSKNVLLK